MEHGAWRWTKSEFVAEIDHAQGAMIIGLRFRLTTARRVTVQAEINGEGLAERRYDTEKGLTTIVALRFRSNPRSTAARR